MSNQALTSRLAELVDKLINNKLGLSLNHILDKQLDEELSQLLALAKSQSSVVSLTQKQALLALISGLYLWNGSMDQSHTISQDLETKAGSYLHGMLHRIEPDYSNAKYWFRMAGGHPDGDRLLQGTLQLLRQSSNEVLLQKLSRESNWNPGLFTDCIAQVLHNGDPHQETAILEQIQAMELEFLLRVEFSKI